MSISQERRLVLILSGLLLFGMISFYSFKMYRYVSSQADKVARDQVWRVVQEKSKNTVVQVFVDVAYFNWVEPYKSPEQGRNRGSGFFINDKGYIVTNFHVVDEATAVGIQIPALGRELLDVEIVGVCPQVDIALLKLTDLSLKKIKKELKDVNYLELGDSDKVVRTQEVLALGYQLGQEKLKSTKGIVSGRERLWGESYIQTTAPVNEGSSGGPSLDSEGKVVGINTATISETENVGYIIPINDVKHVVKSLYKTKFLRRPKLGCEFNIATKEMVEFLKAPEPGGVYISRVYKGSLVEKVGVKSGDLLYKINGYPVDRFGEVEVPWSEDRVHLGDVINRFELGKKVSIEIGRSGKLIEKELDFRCVDLLPIRIIYPEYDEKEYEIIGGMVVMELRLNHIPLFKKANPYIVKFLKRENQYESRLLITHVFSGSQTKKARSIFRGNIIEAVNGQVVKNLEDFRSVLKASKKTGYLTVKSTKKRLMVLSLDKVLKDEDRLSKTYRYKKSKTITDLI